MLHMHRLSHLAAGQILKDTESHALGTVLCLSEPPSAPRTRPAIEGSPCAHVRGVGLRTPIRGKGWNVLKIREAKRVEMATEEEPAVNHGPCQRFAGVKVETRSHVASTGAKELPAPTLGGAGGGICLNGFNKHETVS